MILNAIVHRLSNTHIESVNAEIRLITRIAFGFTNDDGLIAPAMLSLGGHRPPCPAETDPRACRESPTRVLNVNSP